MSNSFEIKWYSHKLRSKIIISELISECRNLQMKRKKGCHPIAERNVPIDARSMLFIIVICIIGSPNQYIYVWVICKCIDFEQKHIRRLMVTMVDKMCEKHMVSSGNYRLENCSKNSDFSHIDNASAWQTSSRHWLEKVDSVHRDHHI